MRLCEEFCQKLMYYTIGYLMALLSSDLTQHARSILIQFAEVARWIV